ncbi:hypothetical protein R6Q59_028078 [Mikania micrantha]
MRFGTGMRHTFINGYGTEISQTRPKPGPLPSLAVEFKEVFENYADRESTYKTLPSNDDWKKVEDVCSFLSLFNEATKIISGGVSFVDENESNISYSKASSSFITSRFGKGLKTGNAKYNQHIDTVESVKSELSIYLDKGVYICESGVNFDALGWWKENKLKFKILSKMAADILSVLITTVASESAFSAGGRVIDPHRSCLGTKMVDMLVCGADWYRHYYELNRKNTKEKDDIIYIELN